MPTGTAWQQATKLNFVYVINDLIIDDIVDDSNGFGSVYTPNIPGISASISNLLLRRSQWCILYGIALTQSSIYLGMVWMYNS